MKIKLDITLMADADSEDLEQLDVLGEEAFTDFVALMTKTMMKTLLEKHGDKYTVETKATLLKEGD